MEGLCGKTSSTFDSAVGQQAMALSCACEQMKRTASGPRVSYSGTEIMEVCMARRVHQHPICFAEVISVEARLVKSAELLP